MNGPSEIWSRGQFDNSLKGEADNIEVLNSKILNVRDILDEIQHPKTPPENIKSVTEIIANEKEKM